MTVLPVPRRVRTIPNAGDLPFSLRAQRGELVWSTIAAVMTVVCVVLLLTGWAVTR